MYSDSRKVTSKLRPVPLLVENKRLWFDIETKYEGGMEVSDDRQWDGGE